MAFSENLTSLHQQWSFRPSFADSFFSDTFSHRETETLTRALQQSLSRDVSETLADTNNNASSFNNFVKSEQQTPTFSGSDPETISKRRNSVSNGKIAKRKSRATKSSQITFITADPTNFQQMVQQVTGFRIGNEHVPFTPVVKPEAKRPGDLLGNYFLPTLDTSEFLLNQQLQPQIVAPPSTSEGHFSFAPVVESGVGLDFDSLQNFPTFEPWGVI